MNSIAVRHQSKNFTDSRRATRSQPLPAAPRFCNHRPHHTNGAILAGPRDTRRNLLGAINATPAEEAAIEAMKKDMAKGDIWDSEALSVVFKVIVVSGIIGVSALLFFVGQPVIDNIINSFPRGGS